MEIEERTAGKVILYALDGRLDTTSAPLLEEKMNKLLEQPGIMLAIDCTRMSYISSSGLRVLLGALKKTSQKSGKLVLFGLNQSIREIFSIAGFERYFIIKTSEEEAIDVFKD